MRSFMTLATVATLCAALPAGCENGAPSRVSPADRAGEMEQAAADRSPFTSKPAPQFSLADQHGDPVTLGELRGRWVVLYFYPKDDTPGCACQATEFTQLLTEFDAAGARVLGVSMDSAESHRAFIAKYGLKLDLLSDPHHRVMEQYGAWTQTALADKTYGRTIRTTFLIDPSGVIRHHWPEVIPQGHADRVRQKLAELQDR
jgi:peroxiredoxin Q/BCP